jgi:hypothetical protein
VIKQTVKTSIQDEFSNFSEEDKNKIKTIVYKNDKSFRELKGKLDILTQEFSELRNRNNKNYQKLLNMGNEMGEAMVRLGDLLGEMQNNILNGQHNKTEIILDKILDIFKQNVILDKKIQNIDESLAEKFNTLFYIVKEIKDIVDRDKY